MRIASSSRMRSPSSSSAALALGALEAVEDRRQLGVRVEDALLGDDGQPEEDRQDDHPQRLGVLGDEVVERRHDAVAGTALVLGVGHVTVQAPAVRPSTDSPGRMPARRYGWRNSAGMRSGS